MNKDGNGTRVATTAYLSTYARLLYSVALMRLCVVGWHTSLLVYAGPLSLGFAFWLARDPTRSLIGDSDRRLSENTTSHAPQLMRGAPRYHNMSVSQNR